MLIRFIKDSVKYEAQIEKIAHLGVQPSDGWRVQDVHSISIDGEEIPFTHREYSDIRQFVFNEFMKAKK